jgi:outer membrane protein insertion porin family
LNLEVSPAGDTRYLRTEYQFQRYWPLTSKISLGFNTEAGWGEGFGDRPYPVFKNFYAGGLGSVRGFDQNSLGRPDNTGAYIGGNRRLNLNTELYVPFPGTGLDKSLRLFTYMDIGNIWSEGEKIKFDSLRASAGIGLSWLSPVGPLKFSIGQPVRKFAGDKIQKFQFQVGSGF